MWNSTFQHFNIWVLQSIDFEQNYITYYNNYNNYNK